MPSTIMRLRAILRDAQNAVKALEWAGRVEDQREAERVWTELEQIRQRLGPFTQEA